MRIGGEPKKADQGQGSQPAPGQKEFQQEMLAIMERIADSLDEMKTHVETLTEVFDAPEPETDA